MAARAVLVIGGQRSGKSRYAEAIVVGSGLAPVYLATATAGDDEMSERIARHRSRRGDAWTLVEEPLDLAGTLLAVARPDATVLVDCLTLWLSNVLACGRGAQAESDRLVATLPQLPGRVVLVSNEVGAGVIPANALARKFADELGTLNQRIAAAADEVVMMVAGLPLFLKRAEG